MAFIRVTVTGLNEAISFFDNASSQIHQATSQTLNEAADVWTTEAKTKAHVITGAMKSSIYKSSPSSSSIEVGAKVPYSSFENKRPGSRPGHGPHNFADMATKATIEKLPSIITKNFNTLFKVR